MTLLEIFYFICALLGLLGVSFTCCYQKMVDNFVCKRSPRRCNRNIRERRNQREDIIIISYDLYEIRVL